jgi:asparagine synthase (glutamine-hydrolysing)
MCGIAAIYNYRRPDAVDAAELARMSERMACRGPDGARSWRSDDGRAALAHRRLAIIDLSERGAQPMCGATGSHIVTFNGEIYNYKELRAALESKGHRFTSNSDTEVLLQLYAEKGDAMVHDLGGMFAFALWDAAKQGLFIARDPFGIKPLYYADDGRCFRVASEVKSLLAGGRIDTSAEPAGHVGFFLLGSVPEPFTLYKGIRALPAGSTLWVSEHGPESVKQYADVSDMLRDAESTSSRMSATFAQEELCSAVVDTVRRHLVADVDVGVFLSSGLDSTTLAAVASELGGSLRTVTLGFDEFRGTPADETPLAEAVARQYNTNHTTVWVTREDFLAARDRVVERMDQPTIDGVNTFFVAQAAASTGLKVALSGLGGDELFGGYSSFRDVPRIVGTFGRLPGVATVGRQLRRITAPILSRFTSPKYASLLEYGSEWGGAYLLRRSLYLPWELPSVLDRDLVRAGLHDLHIDEELNDTVNGITSTRSKVSALEASWYMRNQLLRDADWASMSSSLEVRVPLVDWTFWKRVTTLIGSTRSSIDKAALAGVPRIPLPQSVLSRPKTGFTIPVRDWLLHDRDDGYGGRGLRGWARFVYERAA